MQNLTLQRLLEASNLRLTTEWQWRTSRLPIHYSWCIWIVVQLKQLRVEIMFMLIITDHFMRYAQALVTSSQSAKCMAHPLWDWFVVLYGLPESIISDQDQNFKSVLISELCKLAKVWKLLLAHTTHKQMVNVNVLIIH